MLNSIVYKSTGDDGGLRLGGAVLVPMMMDLSNVPVLLSV
jgi:hypothetical protein